MTYESGLFCRPTESLVLPTQRKFHPLEIPVPHHQLRHLISTTDPDWIYVATGQDIYSINISTQRRCLLVTLPFTPQCFTAGLGWLAAGGRSNGDCAFIALAWKSRQPQEVHSQAEVDSVLPLGLDTASRRLPQWLPNEQPPNAEPCPELTVQELGGSIVNSVTIHDLRNSDDAAIDEPVVVLSNNDATVKIFSLLKHEVIETLKHPFPMNYSIISPDSEILVAVGDECRVFFYKRKQIYGRYDAYEGNNLARYRWELIASPTVGVEGHFNCECAFTIAFSPSGHLCAVGSQEGLICVFGMEALKSLRDDDSAEAAIQSKFLSSRPSVGEVGPGAVRSMAFSPEPWDLLVWAEDVGRAGIADVRQTHNQGFSRRQVLHLDLMSADLELCQIEDVTDPFLKELDPEARVIRQYREAMDLHDDPTSFRQILGRTEAAATAMQRRLRRQNRPPSHGISDLPQDLTDEERHIINAIGSSRYTLNETESSGVRTYSPPYSVHYLPPGSSRRPGAANENADTSEGGSYLSRVAPSHPRHPDSIREFIRERNLVRNRGGDRFFQPRRRSSVVLSQGNTNSSSANLAPRPSGSMRWTVSPSRMPGTDQEAPSANFEPPAVSASMSHELPATTMSATTASSNPQAPRNDPWRTIQNALESERPASSSNIPSMPLDRLEAALEARSALRAEQAYNDAYSQEVTPAWTSPPSAEERNPGVEDLAASARIRRERDVEIEAVFDRQLRAQEERQRQRARLLAEREQDDPARVMRMRERLERQAEMVGWDSGPGLRRVRAREDGLPLGTAGVGWTPDGRRFYVGTEKGLFEYQVNLHDRKTLPALSSL